MEEREEEREGKRALREEPALARAPRHFVRMRSGPHNKKVVHSFDLLLYMLAIRWAVDDMALAYSQQLAILLTMLLESRREKRGRRASCSTDAVVRWDSC